MELVVGLLVCSTAVFVAIGEASLGDAHQLIEHDEFEFEFDDIKRRLHGDFSYILPGVLEADEDNIEPDTDAVDHDKLPHDLACQAVVDRPQHTDSRYNIHGCDDELLKTESCQLDTLDNVEFRLPVSVVVRIGSAVGDNRGTVKCESVEDDHAKDESQSAFSADDQV